MIRVTPLDRPSNSGELLIEAKDGLTPAAAEIFGLRLVANGQPRTPSRQTIVVSPWLSPRTREVIDDFGFGYLDLAGNVSVQLGDPTLFVKMQGSARNPRPPVRGRRGLSGPRASRLVRELVDHRAPRRARELAVAAGVSESYVSGCSTR